MSRQKFFSVMFALVFFASLSSLLAPFFIQIWQAKGVGLTGEKIGFIILLIVASKVLSIVLTLFRERFAKDFNKANFLRYVRNAFNMEYDSIIEKGALNLLERSSMAVNSIYFFMTGGYVTIWSSVVVLVACLLLIGKINFVLAAVMLTALPVNYFGYRFLNKKLAEKSREMQKNTGEGFQEVLSYLREVDYLKQLADREAVYSKLDRALERVYGSMAGVNEYAGSMTVVLEGINEVIKNLLLLLVVYDYVTASSGIYSIILVTLLLPLYFKNVSTITNVNIQKRDYNVALDFESELLAHAEKDGSNGLEEIDEIDLELRKIKVRDLELPFTARGTFKKGDIIRINGSNGSGKSTFARGLVKFRALDQVKINGSPIETCKNADLRRRVEYVVQNAPIVNGTLRDNMLLGVRTVDDSALKTDGFIQTILQKKSLDDWILADGANLSGGEKQKISFARALLSRPDVLILDEICSNIDRESSEEIYAYLNRTRNERITFIISHDDLPQGLANHEVN